MTDLDRLLELKDKILVEKFKHIRNENIDSTQLEQEYQSLYEKLKDAEEFHNQYGNIKLREEIIHIRDLIQNQKTPEDIEKIRIHDEVYMCKCVDNIKSLEKEIQYLKEELELKNRTITAFDDKLRICEQDSKTNADVVEKIRMMMNQLDSYRLNNGKDSEFFILLQSILKETK